MSNKKLGNNFEQEFAEILSEHGFWVHLLQQNNAGQPADVIAVKDRKAWLIDCKVCSHNVFPLSRIEDNQLLAMELWRNCGNLSPWFAMKLNDNSIFMVNFSDLAELMTFSTKANEAYIRAHGIRLGDWINVFCD